MWWRVQFLVVVLGSVANLVLAQDGGVPLPGLPPQQASSDPTAGASLDFSSGGGGVPLPPHSSDVPQSVGHDGSFPLGGGGVPLPPVHGSAAGPVGGFGDDPVFVVPLEQGSGVSLPPSSGAGVPLPPYDVSGAGGPAGAQQPTLDLGGAPGGLRHVHDPHVDATVLRVLGLANVRDHLQLRTRADKAVKISEVVTAHKQVVTGQLVHLTLRVGETNCPIGTPDVSGCPLDHTEDDYICEIVVWERPWLNSSKVIEEKSRCAETEDDNDFNIRGFSRLASSPSEVPQQRLPASISEQQLGLEAFNYVDRASESKFRGDMVNFHVGKITFDPLNNTTKVQMNVEYGFKMCLRSPDEKTDPRVCPRDTQRDHYVCSVYVVHNPNQISTLEVIPVRDSSDDNEIHCEKRRSVDEELVVPVRAPCLGCPQPAPLNDATILEIADFALKEYDRTADEDDLHMILRLVKAQTQVVAGIKYYLTVELAETECKKTFTGVDVNRTFCSRDLSEDTKICDLHIVDQPWVPARDLVAAQCYDKDNYPATTQDEFIVPVAVGTSFAAIPSGTGFQSRTSTFGGQAPVTLDENTRAIAQMVVSEYNRREDDREYYKLMKVHEATPQDASGMSHVVVEMAETNCNKFDPSTGNGEHCIENPREEREVCSAQIHEQAPGNRRIVSMSCEDLDDYLRDRLMPTLNQFHVMDHPFLNSQGQSASGNPVPINDPKVREIAAFVLDQYNLRGDEDELYVLTNIVSAHTQNAGGVAKYLLELEAAETHCKKYLPVADPSRCHIDYSEEREICQAEVNVPADPAQAKTLTRLYCDERDDYYTNKLRGRFFSGASHQPGGSASTLTGAWVAANVNDSSIRKLGHLIADEFDLRSDEDNLFIFHTLVKAQKMITSGLKYHLVVELLETVCPKYKRSIDKTRCVPDIGEDPVMCEADILIQPWLSKQQVTNLQCADKDDFHEGDDSVEVLLPRVHPSAHARPVFKSHFVVRTSDESIESNERFYHPSGVRNRQHDTEEDDDDSEEFPNFRGRRGIPGGYQEGDKNSPKVREIADFAISSMDELSEDPRVRVVKTVDRVETQVVAGVNYKLSLTVHWTTCLKADEVEDLSTCPTDPNEDVYSCTVIVYDVPWTNTRRVTESACRPKRAEVAPAKRARRGLVGGFSEADVNEAKIQEMASFAVQAMDSASDDRYVRRVEEVLSAATQVVAGVNYRMNIKVYWTTCLKEASIEDLSSCSKDTSRPVQTCEVVVYERSWANHTELTSSSCN
ncbi:uncharacterized protein [Palaemon carinicauda]|uniref:uncharacterized protein isoform X2 n=1 Tax=Palaemon carinicauda TaxID=392227 RepID=UPI0035B6381C